MSEPLISVTVPVYNTEKYLNNCLDSIINQSYKNLEIILVDDGSTDSSGKICDDYALKDDRIKVIHQHNGGLSLSRNIALDNCKGDYYVLINSDDYIEIDYCEKLLNAILKTGADVATCAAKSVPENAEPDYYYKNIIETTKLLDKIAFFKEIYLRHIDGNMYGCDVSSMYSKKIGSTTRYPVELMNAMDGWFAIDVWLKSKNYVILESEKYYWRKNPQSITNSLIDSKISAFSIYTKHILEIIEHLQTTDLINMLLQETIIANLIPLRALAYINDINHIENKTIKEIVNYIRKNFFFIKKNDLSRRVKIECAFIAFFGFPLYRFIAQLYVKNKILLKKFKK